MKKLRLDIDELRVSSFISDESVPAEGTVHAHVTALCSAHCDTENITCANATCGQPTCRVVDYSCANSCTDCGTYYCAPSGASCEGSCAESCNGTCAYTGCASC